MTAIASDEHRHARVETETGSLGYDRSVIDYTLPLDELPDPLPIEPLSKPFDVTITPPGSKSITCRAYVLAALADGESKIIRPLRADDTDTLLDALCTLGAEARWDGEDVYIKGVNGRFPRGGEVNLGDGGAPTRFMIACACLAAEPVIVDGSKRMRERPIAEGVDMLRKLGATIEYVAEEGRLPVRVVPSAAFTGGEIEIGRTASSQFISALMLVASVLPSGITVKFADAVTSSAYVILTLDTLRDWSLQEKRRRKRFIFSRPPSRKAMPDSVELPHQDLKSRQFFVDCDAGSAAYWCAATVLTPQAEYLLYGIGHALWQPDLETVRELCQLADFPDFGRDEIMLGGLAKYKGIACDCSTMPDGAMTLATVLAMAISPSTLAGLHTLRHKETDRIAALANELRKIGCTIETTDDSITIDPSTRHDDPVVIETYNDHRMAMAFGVLGLARPGISITNPACVSKSYPTFWRDFAKLYQ